MSVTVLHVTVSLSIMLLNHAKIRNDLLITGLFNDALSTA
jgi:hypothetical protein